MATRAERARWMLNFPGVRKKEAAAAMGVDPSAVSRLLRAERRISADEFDRLEEYFKNFRSDGFEEPFQIEVSPAPALSPIYPARVVAGGDWIVDLAATPDQHLLGPASLRGFPEAYGFRAPDEAAWPRYKPGEIVWVSPGALVLSGDDVFAVKAGSRQDALKGRVAELKQHSESSLSLTDFRTHTPREFNRKHYLLYKLAPREH